MARQIGELGAFALLQVDVGVQRIVSAAVDQVGESVALNVSNADTFVVLGYEAQAARFDPQVDDAVALFELVEFFQDGD